MTSVLLPEPEIDHPYRAPMPVGMAEARRYCERLAKSHYENFLVAGMFCPRSLRQHFYNVYSYCRVSDDLGDEIGDTEKSLALLEWWASELEAMYRGEPRHPVFVALSETVARFSIPIDPFRDLLTAFRQDQRITRYARYEDLLNYCAYSANPVGRLVLYLYGYKDAPRMALSDKTCTALQLANFWQDVKRDLEINRVYLPLEDIVQFGYTEKELLEHRFTPEFARLMRFEIERTRALFEEGLELCSMVDRRIRLDIEMFNRGGLEVLRRIERQNYDVLTTRPSVPKSRQVGILFTRLMRNLLPG